MLRRPGDIRLAIRLRRSGIRYPLTTIWEARRTNTALPDALALLDIETAGGTNEFGHDPTIFAGAGKVTKRKYLAYKRQRGPEGRGGMQGVGPTQLTWYAFQDAADHLGGCWRPTFNMRVGFDHLHHLQQANGTQEGAARFNGTGAAAEAYGRRFMQLRAKWANRIA